VQKAVGKAVISYVYDASDELAAEYGDGMSQCGYSGQYAAVHESYCRGDEVL
jgi:hypothetical protein